MARSQSLPFSLLVSCVALFICSTPLVFASQRSIHLDANGLYKGLVVGFSSDFSATESYRAALVKNVMHDLQNASDILNEMLGVQFGEVTIVLPDGWNIADELRRAVSGVDADAQFRPLQEADIVLTDSPDFDKAQILTMQFGQCGEGALPINFPKVHLSQEVAPRLFAHQWLLYRYGVFNELGYTKDPSYPVYYLPADGGVRNNTSPQINSCSNVPKPIMVPECSNMVVDPTTGLPDNLDCDVVPTNHSIDASFLYAPTVAELKLCNSKTHDFLAPNKQNVLCDYQSAEDVIQRHPDFDSFKHILKRNRTLAPIKFHLWQSPAKVDECPNCQKAFISYSFPSDYAFQESFLRIIKLITALPYSLLHHNTKVSTFDSSTLYKADWKPSSKIGLINPIIPISGSVDLNKILNQVVNEFTSSGKQVSGTCVFVFSGKHPAINVDNELQNDNLAAKFNAANVTLRVLIIDALPSTSVVKFFDQLTSKLTSSSSVHYALATAQSQSFSLMSSVMLDAIQDTTEQGHILLKQDSTTTGGQLAVNFTIDDSFKSLSADNYRLLIEVFTTTTNTNNIKLSLTNSVGAAITEENADKSAQMLGQLYYGKDLSPGMYHVTFNADPNDKITVSVRVLTRTNSFRFYEKDAPIVAKCWLQADAHSLGQYPLRGYVQVSQGLNGPVHSVDVRLSVRTLTTGQPVPDPKIVQLLDNGRGSPDLTEQDGIYSTYLDQLFVDQVDAVFAVQARIYSEGGISKKPANFGNTVMWSNKPRCCGSKVTSSDEVTKGQIVDRVINCGSFHRSLGSKVNHDKFAINDLRLVAIDPDNRTVTLQWNSPLDAKEPKFQVKAFYSIPLKSNLTMDIKENFDTKISADVKTIETSTASPPQHFAHYDQNQFDLYDDAMYADSPNLAPTGNPRSVIVRIDQPEEGFYLLAVKERDDSGAAGMRQTKPSNIVPVYLKSNVPIEDTSALAIDDRRLSDGPRREPTGSNKLLWWHWLLIGLGVLLILLLLVIFLICMINRNRRHASKKESHVDYEVKKPTQIESNGRQQPTDPKNAYYLNQDASSLISNDRSALPNSNVSNNTSCSSVNTVDNGPTAYMAPQHMEPTHRSMIGQINHNMEPDMTPNLGHHHHQHQHGLMPPAPQHTPSSQHSTNPSLVKELNVTTLLPNSWDAKELLDHWGRVQEAKQRQESPPVMRMQTASPSIPSYGGSSLDNYNNQGGYHQFQPATVQQSMQQHYPHEAGLDQTEYLQPPLYAPYSNASSIWQHQQQQQQAAAQSRQYQPMAHHMAPYSAMAGYDDNGLPEYSVVRKHHPNISQV